MLLGDDTIARVPLSGGAPRPVLKDARYAGADWSPDGKGFAVLRNSEGRGRLEFPIGRVLFETDGALDAPRFSPSGDQIAVWHREATRSVLLVPTSGGNNEGITSVVVSKGGSAYAYERPLRGRLRRYLGYIADEMSLGLHELGSLASKSTCEVRIRARLSRAMFSGAGSTSRSMSFVVRSPPWRMTAKPVYEGLDPGRPSA